MGFSEAFPELDFHRAQAAENRERDNKQRGESREEALGEEKVCCAVT